MLNNVATHKPVTRLGEGLPIPHESSSSGAARQVHSAEDGYQGPRTFTGTLRLEKERLFFAPDPGKVLPRVSQALYAQGLQSDLRVQRLGFADLGTLSITTSASLEAELVGQDREAVTRALAALNKVGGGWRVSVFEPNNAPK